MLNCDETSKYLDAYADGELDNRLNLDIEEHLGSCTRCGQELANIRALKTAIRQQLNRPEMPPAVRADIEAVVRSHNPATRRTLNLRKLSVIAALVFLTVGALLYWLDREQGGITPVYAAVMTSEHNNCWSGGLISFEESDPVRLSEVLYVRLGFRIGLHQISLDGKTLLGGNICYFLGRKGAHVFLKDGHHHYSYYAFRREGLPPPSGKKSQSATGRKMIVDSKDGDTLVTWEDAEFYHALVTDAPEAAARSAVL